MLQKPFDAEESATETSEGLCGGSGGVPHDHGGSNPPAHPEGSPPELLTTGRTQEKSALWVSQGSSGSLG